MNLLGMLRSSEFWVAVATGLGQLGATLGFWPQATFNDVLLPAIVYIISRIIGKVAKANVPTAAILLALVAVAPPSSAASLWDAASVGIGAQGAWFDGGDQEAIRDIEATGRGAFSITPHISLVGGLAYGFGNSYTRSSVGVRLTATDVNDRNFSVGLGIARHFHSEPGGLDEWCGEAGIGWKPLAASEILLTASSSYGLDSSRRLFTIGAVYPIKIVF